MITNCIPCRKAMNSATTFTRKTATQKAIEVGKQNGYTMVVVGIMVTDTGKEKIVFLPANEEHGHLKQAEYHSIV